MKRLITIISFVVCASAYIPADDFIDDVYYLPQVELNKKLATPEIPLTPYYNKAAKEIIFIDTVPNTTPDSTIHY